VTDYERWTDEELIERLIIEASLNELASRIDMLQVARVLQERRKARREALARTLGRAHGPSELLGVEVK
jgi:hypothetical protein